VYAFINKALRGNSLAAVGADKAAAGNRPFSLAVKTFISVSVLLKAVSATFWTGAAAMKPVAIGVQAVLDRIITYV